MKHRDSTRGRGLLGPNLIAWLSLCLLAAAWGRTLDANLQRLWAEVGAFGLATAVGLEAVHRARQARDQQFRDRAIRRRLEDGLSRLSDESATLDAMNLALRRLIDDVARRKGPQRCASLWSKRQTDAEILRHYPIEISPVDESSAKLAVRSADIILGTIRQLSTSAIAFDHTDALGARVVIVRFRTSKGVDLSVVVDIIWTEKDGDGFVSGGTVLAAGAPGDTAPTETVPSKLVRGEADPIEVGA
jgi:hypothetical protein